jgi:hypothetical protein
VAAAMGGAAAAMRVAAAAANLGGQSGGLVACAGRARGDNPNTTAPGGWRHTYKMRAQPATSKNSMAPWGRAPCNTTTAP